MSELINTVADKAATISENNAVIAENEQKVYEAGYTKGYNIGANGIASMCSNALVGTEEANGAVCMDGVSPIEHLIKVTSDGEMVTRYGKNLFDESADKIGRVNYKNADGQDESYFGFSLVLRAGTYTIHAEGDPAAYNNEDYIYGNLNAEDGTHKTNVNIVVAKYLRPVTFDAEDGDVLCLYNAIYKAGVTDKWLDQSKEIISHYHYQLEVGSEITAYEPYVEPLYVPVIDGVANVPSLSPATTIVGEGTIKATYNRDINKAYADLVNAIIALGGNV